MQINYSIVILLLTINISSLNHQPKGIICNACESLQESVLTLYTNNKEKIYSTANSICKLAASSYLCDYFVYEAGFDLLDNEKIFLEETNYICSHTFPLCDKTYKKYDFEKFRNDLYKNYPIIKKTEIKKEKKLKEKKNFKTLTLNDVHVQKDYLYNGRVNCKDPSGCCYEKMEEGEEGPKANYWGTPNSKCDIPKYFWEKTLENLKKEEFESDFILLLGDNYGHNYFRDDGNTDLFKWNDYFYESILKNFPDKKIIPVLGNHETDPVDYFDFDDKENIIIKKIYKNFEKFIDNEKIEDYINNGFYELEYDDFGVKFIVLNSQMTDILNFYLIKKHSELLNFFEKLTDSVYESEKKDQKVILLNHINFGNDGAYDAYEKNMYALIERFNQTITTSLSGHTHSDEFRFIKNQKEEIIHINYISPSITTFANYNPSFRIYNFENGKINDYNQYRFDIDFYNKEAEKKIYNFDYKKAYSFKNEYNITNWETFEDYKNFNLILEQDKETQKKYITNKYSRFEFDDWEKESYKVKCEILGARVEQKKCFDTVNGGSSIFDFFSDPILFFRYLFIKPWMVLVD